MTSETHTQTEAVLAAADRIYAEKVQEASNLLRDARVYVAECDASWDTRFLGPIGKKICKGNSFFVRTLDWYLGNSKGCYCCAALRAGFAGFGLGSAVMFLLEALLKHI